MIFSRRLMLLGLATSAATVGTSASFLMSVEDVKQKLRPTGKGRRGVSLSTATVDDWSLQKGSLFTVDTGEVLELIDVQRFPTYEGRPSNLRAVAFKSTFEVKKGNPLSESRTYRVNHREGGQFDLFLSHGSPDRPMRMIAVMN